MYFGSIQSETTTILFKEFDNEVFHFGVCFRIVITPHVAGITRARDVVTCVEANIRRFLSGEPLANVVKWDQRY